MNRLAKNTNLKKAISILNIVAMTFTMVLTGFPALPSQERIPSAEAADNYGFITKWGSFGSGDGQFNYPYGVTVDTNGNVYVVDTDNNRIQKFSSTGAFETKWGSNGSGDGQFDDPYGVTVDTNGNVYVADTGNNRIQKFSSTGAFETKWGSYGSGDGQFGYPYGVTVDTNGNVYVADTDNNRIQKFSSTGAFETKWGSGGSGDGQFGYPYGVTVDTNGNVYVADRNNHRIQKFSSTGAFETKWGSNGSGDGQFDYPFGVTVDTNGNIYVADTWNNRIQMFALDTTPPTTTLATEPETPDGTNGWYRTIPTVTLSSNEPGTTSYNWNTTSSFNTYTEPFTAPEGTNTLYYYSTDEAGNEEEVQEQTFKVDAISPTVVLSTGAPDPTNEAVSVTASFSEDVTGFGEDNITVGNGSAGSFITVSGSTYTFLVTPTSDGEVTVDVAAGVAQDAAGNTNTAAGQLSVTYDATDPSITKFSVPTISTDNSPTLGFSISWNGSDNDGGSGMGSYQLQYRRHTTTAWSNLLVDGDEWTTKKSRRFIGKAGYTYYFKIRAKDNAENISNWSYRKTIVPYDDTALTYSEGWTSSQPTNSFMNSHKYSAKKGEWATLTFTGKAATLIASTGPYGGKMDVYIRDKSDGVWSSYNKIKTIDRYSETYKRRVSFPIKSWNDSSTHQIKFVVTRTRNLSSLGYRGVIDGVAVLK